MNQPQSTKGLILSDTSPPVLNNLKRSILSHFTHHTVEKDIERLLVNLDAKTRSLVDLKGNIQVL